MRTVLIRLPVADLAAEMAEMREWLDQHKCEPAKFTCDRYRDLVVIRANFANNVEGEAFKRRFDTAGGPSQSPAAGPEASEMYGD